jgi:predicted permease
MWQRIVRRLRYWRESERRARLLREEIETHIDMKAQEMMEDGMAEAEARGAARRQFGNLTLAQEDSRSAWIARWLSDLVQDTAYAMRAIRNRPGFAAVAALSAALGIGACTLIFGLANYALLRPLPASEPSRLMSVSGISLRSGKIGTSLSWPDFEDLRQAQSVQGMAASFPFIPATISSNGEPQRYWGSVVTANYFDVVRPHFVLGRGFDPQRDDRNGEAPSVVLSLQLWRSRFGADPAIIGRSIQLNGRGVTVVGVTDAAFRGTEPLHYSEFWLPVSVLESLPVLGPDRGSLRDRSRQWLMAVARLRDGVSESAARAEIEAIGQRLSRAYPETNRERAFYVERAGQAHPGFRKLMVVFFALLLAVGIMVLCTACANVANLLLARASARRKEIATRLAIGAGRSRLVRQLLTESILLALLGGIGGYVIARAGAGSIAKTRVPVSMPVDLAISLDYRVMLFCLVLSALTGVVFGLVPALRATRPDLVSALKDEAAELGQFRWFGLRNLLVVAQVTICTVLLICSGLFLRSLASAGTIDIGFSHRNLLMAAFDPGMNHYGAADAGRIVDAILERARAIPGVESATLSNGIPLNLEGTRNAFETEDGSEKLSAEIFSIAPGFFDTFGIRMIAGEDFRPGVPSDDIAIVNQALASRAFPKQNPIGRHIRYMGRTVRITGLVATVKSRTIGEDPRPSLYFPLAREVRGNDSLTGITLILRTKGNPAAFGPAVREEIRHVDPALAVFDMRTMEAQLERALIAPRTAAYLFGFAGFMGLLISIVGIYGVISFTVARQTREIGIRVALGARKAQVIQTVLMQGLRLVIAGLAIGLSMALALSRTTASLLYGVSATDTLTFAVVPVLLLSIASAACLIPARRAASLDPLRALRYE